MISDQLSSGADQPYWAGLLEGRVQLPRCVGCGKWHWPAVWRCGECGSLEHVWHEVALEGKIYTWTRTWHYFEGTEAFDLPFVSVIVELPEAGGIRLIGTMQSSDNDVSIGMPVTGSIRRISAEGREIPALVWSLEEAS